MEALAPSRVLDGKDAAMRRRNLGRWVGAAAVCLAFAVPARAAPANNLMVMYGALNQCLGEVRIAPGTDVTVRFMLNRSGVLIGKPQITHAHWGGDESDRKASAASIAQGFDHCLPVEISDALGGAIAGRLIAYRFHAPAAHEQKS